MSDDAIELHILCSLQRSVLPVYPLFSHMSHYPPTCISLPFSKCTRDSHVLVDVLVVCHASRARHVTAIITRHIALNSVCVCSGRAIQGRYDVITIFFGRFFAQIAFLLVRKRSVSKLKKMSLCTDTKHIAISVLL